MTIINQTRRVNSWLWAIVPLMVMIVQFSRALFDPSIGYPDADRILMDGVFIADLLRDLPFDRPLEYVLTYYVQYPALSIGYRPPFFPFLEAISNLIIGVHHWSGRIALMAASLAGGTAMYILVRRMYGVMIAVVSTTLLASLPFIAQWSWYTMAEIPALSMVLVTAYFFYRYMEDGATRYAYLTAVMFALAMWTKPTTVFMVLWLFPYMLWHWGARRVFLNRTLWGAISVLVVLVLPLAAMVLWLGDLNTAQSVGANVRGEQLPRLHPDNLMLYPQLLLSKQLTWPVAVLALVGAVLALLHRDRRILFFLLLICATYLFFTLLNDPHVSRYTLFWIPAFCVLAALPAAWLKSRSHHVAFVCLAASAVAFNVYATWDRTPQHITAFDKAAEFVVRYNTTEAVFVDAYNNGYFTFFMRLNDPDRRFFVLRGDKLLSSSAVEATTWLRTHAADKEDIRRILSQHQVNLLVVESNDYTGLPIHKELRRYLQSDDFVLRARFPIFSNLKRYREQTLDVYEFLAPDKGLKGDLVINLPIVGKVLRMPASGGKPVLEPLNSEESH